MQNNKPYLWYDSLVLSAIFFILFVVSSTTVASIKKQNERLYPHFIDCHITPSSENIELNYNYDGFGQANCLSTKDHCIVNQYNDLGKKMQHKLSA